VQFGVFSPILRLHSTNNQFHERRPWGYDAETTRITRRAMQLRHALIPYLYSMAWREHQDGISLIRPMYHLYPEMPQAYACPDQYSFGSELIAAPFTRPLDPDTRLSRQVVWLPPGDWYELDGSQPLASGWHAIYGGLEEVPVFAHAGAILPLGALTGWGGIANPDSLAVHIYPGADNRFELYEDDGESQAYLAGDYALTTYELSWQAQRLDFHIHPVSGQRGLVPARRDYTLVFHALSQPEQVRVTVNGVEQAVRSDYDRQKFTLTLSSLQLTPVDECAIRLESSLPLAHNAGSIGHAAAKLVSAFRMETDAKRALYTALPQLMADPTGLAAFQAVLTPSQRRGLLETLTGAGIELNTNTGQPIILLWNNRADPAAQYTLVLDEHRYHHPAERFRSESGALPVFDAIWPREAWGERSALLKARFSELLTVELRYRLGPSSSEAELSLH
jgi:hypothetical protein